MGIRAMLWAWNWSITPTQKLVLIALAWHSDDSGNCWPSPARLARLSGLSERSVRRAVKELEGQKLINRIKRTTDTGALTSHLYVLQLEHVPPVAVTGPSGQPVRTNRTDRGSPTGQHGRQKVIEPQRKGSRERIEEARQRAEAAAEAHWQDQDLAPDREKWLALLTKAMPKKN